ncbi:hypothetical protein HK104_009524 [Borealophlyctis nickersoniae]|nr:hypothetical protein HK104_009524 [Borealophlyctis nickersoniae]
MAANFWESSQRKHWHLTREDLAKSRSEDLERITERELMKVGEYYVNVIHKLGRRLQLRQQVVATAIVYFKRFYTRNSYHDTDSLLVVATCVYLACKVEECPQHITKIAVEIKHVLAAGQFYYDTANIAEFEFYLLEDLNFYTILYHPYRPLIQFCDELGLEKTCLQTAWFVVNDAYRTDVPLLYPPHMIAAAALFFAIHLNDEVARSTNVDLKQWFTELNVDMEEIAYITQDILDMYQILGEYTDEHVPGILKKLKTGSPTSSESSTPARSSSAPQTPQT